MKRVFPILTILIFLITELWGQSNQCNCLENLNTLILKTEENYAGFPSKVNSLTKKQYTYLVNLLKSKSSNTTNPDTCYLLLKSYVKFFNDKHFMIGFEGNKLPENARELIDENAFKKYLLQKNIHPIEGIWRDADNSIKIGIQKKSIREYQAIILESKDSRLPVGLIYFTFKKVNSGWIAQEFNTYLSTDIVTKQKGNLLHIWNQKIFGKIYPTSMSAVELEELNTWKNNNNGLVFKKLSVKTSYLKIPTFKSNDDKILQLVSQNDSIIQKSENLIVDLTVNAGGNTGWVAFLPYFMTNPIIQFDTYLRTTPDNIKSKLADIEPFVVNPIPNEYKKYFPEKTLSAYKKAYEELPTTKKSFYPIPGVTFPLDSIMKYPKKIALIVDDFTGSSAEYFFFISKQSKKTRTYGINTVGMMDYEGMSNPTALPFDKFIVTIPIVKSSWTDKHPIDRTGFRPDILLNKINQTKWLEYVQKDLEKQ